MDFWTCVCHFCESVYGNLENVKIHKYSLVFHLLDVTRPEAQAFHQHISSSVQQYVIGQKFSGSCLQHQAVGKNYLASQLDEEKLLIVQLWCVLNQPLFAHTSAL